MTLKKAFGLALVVAVWLSFVKFVATHAEARDKRDAGAQSHVWQVEAVSVGHGRWVPDKEGNTTFQWLATKTSEVK